MAVFRITASTRVFYTTEVEAPSREAAEAAFANLDEGEYCEVDSGGWELVAVDERRNAGADVRVGPTGEILREGE